LKALQWLPQWQARLLLLGSRLLLLLLLRECK
jgi:hypothetical protein